MSCRLGLQAAWLPDILVFLDLSPEISLTRIASRGKVDRHENLADLTQAREMYLKSSKRSGGTALSRPPIAFHWMTSPPEIQSARW